MGKLNYRIPNTNDFREIYVKVTDTLPIGAVCQYAGSTAPSGYLMCNGQAVSRTTYADLFNAIGTSFGAGDGVTTFNLPNFNGRVPVGLDGIDTEFDTLGETGGSKKLQQHSHTMNVAVNGTIGGDGNKVIVWNSTGTTYDGASGAINNAGTGDSGNLQPYLVVNYIIKASKKVALDKGNVVDSLDGSDTDSAPSVRAVNEALVEAYSTDEVKTNKIWIDGKPIYQKVIIGTITDSSSSFVNIAHNVSNIDTKIDVSASYIFSNSLFKTPNDAILEIGFTDSAVQYANSNSYILNSTIRFIIEYTKTTD